MFIRRFKIIILLTSLILFADFSQDGLKLLLDNLLTLSKLKYKLPPITPFPLKISPKTSINNMDSKASIEVPPVSFLALLSLLALNF